MTRIAHCCILDSRHKNPVVAGDRGAVPLLLSRALSGFDRWEIPPSSPVDAAVGLAEEPPEPKPAQVELAEGGEERVVAEVAVPC